MMLPIHELDGRDHEVAVRANAVLEDGGGGVAVVGVGVVVVSERDVVGSHRGVRRISVPRGGASVYFAVVVECRGRRIDVWRCESLAGQAPSFPPSNGLRLGEGAADQPKPSSLVLQPPRLSHFPQRREGTSAQGDITLTWVFPALRQARPALATNLGLTLCIQTLRNPYNPHHHEAPETSATSSLTPRHSNHQQTCPAESSSSAASSP